MTTTWLAHVIFGPCPPPHRAEKGWAMQTRSIRAGQKDCVEAERMEWSPPGVEDVLTISMSDVFGPASDQNG
jgi:hypothetical protein